MKKVLVIISFVAFLLSPSVFAEEHIEGLDESINRILMHNYITDEQIQDLEGQLSQAVEKEWTSFVEYYIKRYHKEPSRNATEFQPTGKEYVLDFNNGLLTTNIDFPQYMLQYSNSNAIEYLMSKEWYWFVPHINSDLGYGDLVDYTFSNLFIPIGYPQKSIPYRVSIYHSTISFMNNTDFINEKLQVLNIKRVSNIWICNYMGQGLVIFDTDKGYFGFDIVQHQINKISEIEELSLTLTCFNKNSTYQKYKPDYTSEAESLAKEGLLYGNENGLDLLKPMTRAEAATILMRALGGENQTPQVASFTDVPTTYWGFEPIEKASRLGIVKGVGDGLFDPEAKVTENQFATMLLRTANETDFIWQTAINLFVERGYITQEQADRMDLFTRGDMAKLIYEAKQHGIIR